MPSPSQSKRSALLDYLATLFGTINGPTATYWFTPGSVQRGLSYVDQMTDDKFPAIMVADSTETRQNITNVGFSAALEVLIIGAVKSPNGVSGAQDELDKLIEDITTALEQDRTQGGRCFATTITKIDADGGDTQARAACYVTAVFKYEAKGVQS